MSAILSDVSGRPLEERQRIYREQSLDDETVCRIEALLEESASSASNDVTLDLASEPATMIVGGADDGDSDDELARWVSRVPDRQTVGALFELALAVISEDRPEDSLDETERVAVAALLRALAEPTHAWSEAPRFVDQLRRKYGPAVEEVLSRDSDDSTGFTIGKSGRYKLKEYIAEGGMGSILRAWDPDLKRTLAMKVMLTGRRGPSDSKSLDTLPTGRLRRFIEEAQVTGQLDHPGIAPVHELGVDSEGRIFFTMRLVRGFTLKEAFQKASGEEDGWNQTRVLGHLLKVCETLAFAHSRGVLHRDIKPANIMVGPFGETYVMDWGLAKVQGQPDLHDMRLVVEEAPPTQSMIRTLRTGSQSDDSMMTLCTADGAIIGTPSYISPEQARGDSANVGPHSDVYAVGALLYELLTGFHPFGGPKRLAIPVLLEKVTRESPEPLSKLAPSAPPELAAICEKAMSREPRDRYPSMGEMAEDMRAFLEQRVVKAYRTGALIELQKWFRRNRALAASLIASVLLIMGGLGAVSFVTESKNRQLEDKNEQLEETGRRLTTANEKAASNLADYQRMADVRRIAELFQQAEKDLWPRRPETIGAMQTWLDQAEFLEARIPEHRRVIAELETNARIRADGSFDFGSDEEGAWKHEVLTSLVSELETLPGEDGLSSEVRQNLAVARSIAEATLEEPATLWRQAIEDIASDEAFGGLALKPQIGLVPLDKNPATGLWEFLLWETGEAPVRDPETGQWRMTPEMGIVFALLPGGTFWMGASGDPLGPNTDSLSVVSARPAKQATLDPFFLSKYEVTQAQWQRLMRSQPSMFWELENAPILPVENVSWPMCRQFLRRLGLELPTEAQWEYACRAGTSTPWYSGTELESLKDIANIAEQAYRRTYTSEMKSEAWDDGYGRTSPVGAFRPNGFGMYDMIGNIFEWCRDTYLPAKDATCRPGDGLRADDPEVAYRLLKGGGYSYSSHFARSSFRTSQKPEYRYNDVGLRPVRTIRD
ncbi:MAG: bifunctional serine/threonine-protein kinase/formylglycine-generating enzyme family protein [Planctomycetota bacterium]